MDECNSFVLLFSGLGSRSRVFLAPWSRSWSRLGRKKTGAGAAWEKSGAGAGAA